MYITVWLGFNKKKDKWLGMNECKSVALITALDSRVCGISALIY